MNIILSEIELNIENLDSDYSVEIINKKTIKNFSGNESVCIIVCSRSLSIIASNLNFPNLRLIQLTSAGFDNVPIENFTEKKVLVANAGDTYSVPISETVIFSMLLYSKRFYNNPNIRIPKLFRKYNLISELYKKKAVIIGAGSIGRELAKRLSAFDVKIDGYAHHNKGDRPYFNTMYYEKSQLLAVLDSYDFVISCLPHNNETINFHDNIFFKNMSINSIFVNVGRRATIDEKALYNALRSKNIKGAILDMFEYLPLPFANQFRNLSNTIILPGVAAISQESKLRLREHIIVNIRNLISGKSISSIIN